MEGCETFVLKAGVIWLISSESPALLLPSHDCESLFPSGDSGEHGSLVADNSDVFLIPPASFVCAHKPGVEIVAF